MHQERLIASCYPIRFILPNPLHFFLSISGPQFITFKKKIIIIIHHSCNSVISFTAKQVVEAVRNAGDRKEYPDNIYGYGVPDIWKACQIELEKKK